MGGQHVLAGAAAAELEGTTAAGKPVGQVEQARFALAGQGEAGAAVVGLDGQPFGASLEQVGGTVFAGFGYGGHWVSDLLIRSGIWRPSAVVAAGGLAV